MMDIKKIASKLANVVKRVGELGHWIAGICILIMMVFVTIDVVGRFFFNTPFRYAYDVTEFSMAGSVFLAMAYTQAVRGHIRVGALTSRLSKRTQSILNIIITTGNLLFFALVIWMGWKLAWMDRDALTMAAYPLPVFWPMLLVPIGALLISLQFVVDLCRYIALVKSA